MSVRLQKQRADDRASVDDERMGDTRAGEPVAACNPKNIVDARVGESVAVLNSEPVVACNPKTMVDKCVGESLFGMPWLSGIFRSPSPVRGVAAVSPPSATGAALESVDID